MPQPRQHCVRWGPSYPFPKGVQPPNFRPMSVVAKQLDGLRCQSWYGGMPRPRRLCVRWGPSSSRKRGAAPAQFLAHVYCGQTSGCMKTPLGTGVPRPRPHCVTRTQLPPPRKGHSSPPLFGPCLLWPRSPISALLSSCCNL